MNAAEHAARACAFTPIGSAPLPSTGLQRELRVHTDGSTFSFNVLLNAPTDFVGGGTRFEPTGLVVRPPRGGAVGHSGQVRHSADAITHGERYLLVGFVGCATQTYEGRPEAEVVADAFAKFGDAAWDRSAFASPRLASP